MSGAEEFGSVEPAAPAAQPQDAVGSEVAPCNTTSNKCISIEEPRSKGFLPLWQGIDTLVVSYKGGLREVIEKRLARLKELAQSKLSEEQASAQYVMGDEIFSVGDKGNGRY